MFNGTIFLLFHYFIYFIIIQLSYFIILQTLINLYKIPFSEEELLLSYLREIIPQVKFIALCKGCRVELIVCSQKFSISFYNNPQSNCKNRE